MISYVLWEISSKQVTKLRLSEVKVKLDCISNVAGGGRQIIQRGKILMVPLVHHKATW